MKNLYYRCCLSDVEIEKVVRGDTTTKETGWHIEECPACAARIAAAVQEKQVQEVVCA